MIKINSNELSRIKNNPINDSNSGIFGSCYYYKKDEIMKIFNNLDSYILNNIKLNVKRTSNIIIYPNDLVFLNKKFIGYTMNKAPGTSLDEIINDIFCFKKDIAFEEFLTFFYDKFIPELKKQDVLMNDIKPCHMFIDDNIYFIDTDCYEQLSNESEDAFKHNVFIINQVLMNLMLDYSEFYIQEPTLIELGNVNFMKKQLHELDVLTHGDVKTFKELVYYKR